MSPEQIQSLIREWIPLASLLDIRVEEPSAGKDAKVVIPYSEKHVRPGGSISGPILMSAADTAMYAAILSKLGEVAMAVTSNLNINFLSRPKDTDLVAECTLLKLGSRLAFCEVEIKSANSDELVAHATGSYAIPS